MLFLIEKKKKKKMKSTPYPKKMFSFLCPLQNVTQMKENLLTVINLMPQIFALVCWTQNRSFIVRVIPRSFDAYENKL